MIRRGILASDLNENNFAKGFIAPHGGVSRSSFSEAVNSRGLEQFQHVFEELSKQARAALPADFQALGELVAIDGSLIDTVLSMHWADCQKKSQESQGAFRVRHQPGHSDRIPFDRRQGRRASFCGSNSLRRTNRGDGQGVSVSYPFRFASKSGKGLCLPHQSMHCERRCRRASCSARRPCFLRFIRSSRLRTEQDHAAGAGRRTQD